MNHQFNCVNKCSLYILHSFISFFYELLLSRCVCVITSIFFIFAFRGFFFSSIIMFYIILQRKENFLVYYFFIFLSWNALFISTSLVDHFPYILLLLLLLLLLYTLKSFLRWNFKIVIGAYRCVCFIFYFLDCKFLFTFYDGLPEVNFLLIY